MRRAVFSNLYERGNEEVRRLQDELYRARRDIVDLMPDDIARLMHGYHDCKTRHDHHAWEQSVVEAVIGATEPDLAASHWQPRARCPLCRGGSSGAYDVGFTIPEGLRRHLEGFGNVHQCSVTRAAFALAREALQESLAQSDQDAVTHTEQRRRTERVFDVGPRKSAMLLDEEMWGRVVRDEAALARADARLAELGFERTEEGNVVSYRLVRDGFEVWADPRQATRLDFTVCPPARSRGRLPEASFFILDNWRHEVAAKFGQRLTAAIETLSKPAGRQRGR